MPKSSDVGVIVGRFQVHRLHDAHLALIKSIYDTHKKTVVILGLSPVRVTTRNPLDFEARKAMILSAFPKATVLYAIDQRDDFLWSIRLDEMLDQIVSPAQSVMLYGGRECFINHYHGKYPTEVYEPDHYFSGTELRKTISKNVKETEDFRAGVIWASANSYPKVFPTVDVAVVQSPVEHQHAFDKVLMVRKPNEKLWRFPGGFVQPSDVSWEQAARREVFEETGAEVGELRYVMSHLVDDWRYTFESDKILTTFFVAEFVFGPVRPADDVAEAAWKPLGGLVEAVVPEHQILLTSLLDRLDRDRKAVVR